MKNTIKNKIIINNQLHKTDTGSDKVQVALLQEDISKLSIHLKLNKKDIVTRRVLLKKVAKFKKFKKRLTV